MSEYNNLQGLKEKGNYLQININIQLVYELLFSPCI